MSTITGVYRGGRIELDDPAPADWAEGLRVSVELTDPAEEIDITGDSPEAIAAWLKDAAELYADTTGSEFPEELDEFLMTENERELATWDERCRKIEGMFP